MVVNRKERGEKKTGKDKKDKHLMGPLNANERMEILCVLAWENQRDGQLFRLFSLPSQIKKNDEFSNLDLVGTIPGSLKKIREREQSRNPI